MIYLGVDPGKSGSIVAIHEAGTIQFVGNDTPEHEIARWLADVACEPLYCFAVLEKVSSSPQQGVRSAFTFGQSYGFLRGLLVTLAVPFETVTPQRWQRTLGCLSKGDKNVTKARAQELAPHFRFTHRTADAFLLAEYGRRLRG